MRLPVAIRSRRLRRTARDAGAQRETSPSPDAPPGVGPADAVGTGRSGGSASRFRSGNLVPEGRVADMFDGIASVYDRMNTIMTLGLDGGWRRAAVAATRVGQGGAVLDVACGTGKLAAALAERVGPFGRTVGIDLAPAMVDYADAHHRDLVQLEFRVANALELPFADGEFDAATIAFGLRNLADYEAGFREMARVVRPGGWVVCLELSVPRPRWWSRVYLASFRTVAPLIGSVFGRRGAYEYLPASLNGFPLPDHLAATMRRAGLVEVAWRRYALGAVALHRGRVPTP